MRSPARSQWRADRSPLQQAAPQGILFELIFAAVIYLPPLQAVFGKNALGVRELTLLALSPILVWGSDELRRWARRRREASRSN